MQLIIDVFVIVPIDEGVLRSLVLYDAHLGVHVVLHVELIAIQVVWGNVHQHCHVGTELKHIVKLEGTDLQYIPIVVLRGYLKGVTAPDVACQSYVNTKLLHYIIYERSGRSLSVRAGDAYRLALAVALGKLQLGEDWRALGYEGLHQWSGVRNAGALYNLVGRQYFGLGMAAFLPADILLVKLFLVLWLDGTHVRNEYLVTFFLCQDCGSYAAFTCSKYC